MWQANPVFTGVWRGLLAPEAGTAQRSYFGCLLVQAAALALWWPKSSLVDALASEQAPEPLLAAVVALGLTTAYYSLRAGAEEFLLSGQQSLREWALSTPLSVGRIVRGGLFGHLMHTLYLLVFSFPLLCVAFTEGGGEWSALAQSLCTVVFQALFFWLAGAVVYLWIGQHGHATYLAIRLLLVSVYLLTALRLPATSQPMVSVASLGADTYTISFGVASPPYQVFLLVHAVMIAILVIVLYAQLQRWRKLG